jgi:hypothetical protein
VGHASKSSGLFRVKASRARVSQSGIKTDGGAMSGGARGTIVEVTLESKLRMDESMQRATSNSATLTLPFLFY